MVYIMIYSFLYFKILFEVSAFKLFPGLNLPDADVLIDNEKGFLLQRVGIYASKHYNDILHTVIPLQELCRSSYASDICLHPPQSSDDNIIELGTIMSSKQASPLVSHYKKHDVLNLINKNITELLSNVQLKGFFGNMTLSIHSFQNNFYVKPIAHHSLESNTNKKSVAAQHGYPYFLKFSTGVIIEQIRKNRIGFTFLPNEEIAVFLFPLMISIDKSYANIGIEDLINEFYRLIVAQSIHILRSCSIIYQDIKIYPPCLIISTLFIRPPPINSFTYTVYNLHPLSIIINENMYAYNNLPTTFGFNSIDQKLIIWNNDKKKSKCVFSKIVQCEDEPTYVSLSSLPCMAQLFCTDQSIPSACEISRSINSQPNIINIVGNIWLFSNVANIKHCNIYSYVNDSVEGIIIHESIVLRLPCDTFMKCPDIQFKSSTCTKTTSTIKSLRSGIEQTSSIIQYSIKRFTTNLESEYKARALKSLQQLQVDLYNNAPRSTKILQLLSNWLVYIILLIASIVITAALKLIEKNIRKQVNKIEKRMNIHADIFSLESNSA